jgi:hypothetical protein
MRTVKDNSQDFGSRSFRYPTLPSSPPDQKWRLSQSLSCCLGVLRCPSPSYPLDKVHLLLTPTIIATLPFPSAPSLNLNTPLFSCYRASFPSSHAVHTYHPPPFTNCLHMLIPSRIRSIVLFFLFNILIHILIPRLASTIPIIALKPVKDHNFLTSGQLRMQDRMVFDTSFRLGKPSVSPRPRQS